MVGLHNLGHVNYHAIMFNLVVVVFLPSIYAYLQAYQKQKISHMVYSKKSKTKTLCHAQKDKDLPPSSKKERRKKWKRRE
eukprot:7013972-Ditylum_brightwellii.AAC.1